MLTERIVKFEQIVKIAEFCELKFDKGYLDSLKVIENNQQFT